MYIKLRKIYSNKRLNMKRKSFKIKKRIWIQGDSDFEFSCFMICKIYHIVWGRVSRYYYLILQKGNDRNKFKCIEHLFFLVISLWEQVEKLCKIKFKRKKNVWRYQKATKAARTLGSRFPKKKEQHCDESSIWWCVLPHGICWLVSSIRSRG